MVAQRRGDGDGDGAGDGDGDDREWIAHSPYAA